MTNVFQAERTRKAGKAYSLGGIDSFVWTPQNPSVSIPSTGTMNALAKVLSEQFPSTRFFLRTQENDGKSWIDVAFRGTDEMQEKAVSIAAIFNGTDFDGEFDKRWHVLKQIGLNLIDWNVDTVIVNEMDAESYRSAEVVTAQMIESVNKEVRKAAPQAFIRKLQHSPA